MNFKELETYKTTINDFSLIWRFESKNEVDYSDLFDNLTILNKKGCEKTKAYINNFELHTNFPFKNDFFSKNDQFAIAEKSDYEIKLKLDSLGFDDNEQVLLTWDDETSLLTDWKCFTTHLSDFFYPSSDDLTILGEKMLWSILFHHSETVYYSTNDLTQKEYSDKLTDYLNSNFSHIKFIRKVHGDFIVDFEIKSPLHRLTLWISSMNKEISVGFEDSDGSSDWHTHMSLFGANTPYEQLKAMSDLVINIFNGTEKVVFNSTDGYFLTDKLEEETKKIILMEWTEL